VDENECRTNILLFIRDLTVGLDPFTFVNNVPETLDCTWANKDKKKYGFMQEKMMFPDMMMRFMLL